MKMSPLMLLCLLGFLLSACGDDAGVSLEGKSATEQANEIVDALCNEAAECGNYEMQCSSSDGNDVQCTSSYSTVSYDECSEELGQDIQAQADCWSERADETFFPLLEECINAMVAQTCVTEEEMEIYISAINAGEEPGSLRQQPEACEQFENHQVTRSCEGGG